MSRHGAWRSLAIGGLLLQLVACGADPALGAAKRDTRTASAAVAEMGARGGAERNAEIDRALAKVESRLGDLEQSLATWEETGYGDDAFRTIAPCLGRALAELEQALRAADLSPPDRLEQARAAFSADGSEACR